MQIARGAGVRVIFDLDVAPSYFAQAKLGGVDNLILALRLVDVLKPCKAAAREITGETDYEKMATKLLALGPKIVALTMGADGCLIAAGNEMVHVAPFKVPCTDTTGAGDAFMGGLSYGLLQGWDYRRVGTFANACAAICCTKVGARSMGRGDDVMALIHAQRTAEASAF
jgi:sugar/nucleoside kinase (ribokinase family)